MLRLGLGLVLRLELGLGLGKDWGYNDEIVFANGHNFDDMIVFEVT